MCAGNPDFPFFQRLAQHFQYRFAKLRQFIQKQNASMRQRDLSRRRDQSASGQRRFCHRMMNTPKRTCPDQRLLTVDLTDNAVYFCDLQTFLQRKRRQDRRDPFGDHRLSASRRSYHQKIMSASHSNLHRTFHGALPAYILKVRLFFCTLPFLSVYFSFGNFHAFFLLL